MSRESRMLAGILLVVLPTVMFGGVSLLSFLSRGEAGYVDKPAVTRYQSTPQRDPPPSLRNRATFVAYWLSEVHRIKARSS